jgi:mono/diheme cytochrome c family protein
LRTERIACAAVLTVLIPVLAGCRQDMQDQPKFIPLRPSSFFADGRSARPLVEGTVARGHLEANTAFYTGRINGQLVNAFPFPITRQVLERGQQRFNIYCSPCHDLLGYGNGMIVRRGFRQPPSIHIDRLRNERAGYFFDVITNGFGAMPDYAAQIEPRDRWAIVAYERALQLSQHASINELSPEERARLGGGK